MTWGHVLLLLSEADFNAGEDSEESLHDPFYGKLTVPWQANKCCLQLVSSPIFFIVRLSFN